MTEFKGRVALVTGGGSGIGRGVALALASQGASVVVADIRQETAQVVVDEIRSSGGAAIGVACDVSDRRSVQAAKQAIGEAYGRVSLLFAIAGVTYCKPLAEISENALDWVIEVNLNGTLNCIHAFLPDMVAARDGHILATSSMAVLTPTMLPYYVPYTAAKAGIVGMMYNLAEELADTGVKCTLLFPGGVRTNMVESHKSRPDRFGGPSDDMITHVSKKGFDSSNLKFRDAEDAARIILRAVQNDRPVVLTDASQRELFMKSFVDPILTAFEDAEAYEHENDPT